MPFRILFLHIIFLTTCISINAQSLSDFGGIPNEVQSPIELDSLLSQLKWESVVLGSYSERNNGFYSNKSEKNGKAEYEYVKQGRVESFEISVYNGEVLEFYFDVPSVGRSGEYYFNKELWLEYVDKMIPDLPENLKLTTNEPASLLKAFYALLGIDGYSEYGWICEYSTVGMPRKQRLGIVEVIEHNRVDLLKQLLNHPNNAIKLCAIDALIYLNKKSKILTNEEWSIIEQFKASSAIINTCGNMGSFKLYETPVSELLSDKAIREIPNNYKALSKLGYL